MYQLTARLSVVTLFFVCLAPTHVAAQFDGVYEFDGGGDGTSWNDADNWEQITDPSGNPISGNPATPPASVTSADIPQTGVIVDNTMPGQTVLDLRVGTASGAGSLSISGGDLTSRDVFVGSAGNQGELNVSGGEFNAGDDITIGGLSTGSMVMSSGLVTTGDDFIINANSSVMMTGGVMSIGDRMVTSFNASLAFDGGQITIGDDLFIFDDSLFTVSDGLLEVADKLRFDDDLLSTAMMIIDGGIVRSNEFGDGIDPLGTVQINNLGVYQVEDLSVADALTLISEGTHFTSSTGFLTASSILLPGLPGGLDRTFTQISVIRDQVVPVPATVSLVILGLLGLALSRTRRTL